MDIFLPRDRIIVAVDTNDVSEAIRIVEELYPHVGAFRLGFEFTAGLVAMLLTAKENEAKFQLARIRRLFGLLGSNVMWDWSLHAAPGAMACAVRAISRAAPAFVTVDASSGILGMRAAVMGAGDSKVLAATVLTSMDPLTCGVVYGDSDIAGVVCAMASVAKAAGVHGIVCAPADVPRVREELQWSGEFVCPGIRPAWAGTDDEDAGRCMTPGDAVRAGVTRLVIGPPLTRPPSMFASRSAAALAIVDEVAAALA